MSSTEVKQEFPRETAVYKYDVTIKVAIRYMIIEADGTSNELEYVSFRDAALELAEDREIIKKLNEAYLAETDLCSNDDNSEDFEEWVEANVEKISGCRIINYPRSEK